MRITREAVIGYFSDLVRALVIHPLGDLLAWVDAKRGKHKP